MKLIGKGRTAEIFLNEKNRVVKLFREGISQNAIKFEYRVSNLIRKRDIPVPHPFELIKIKNRLGIEYEYIEGYSLLYKMIKKPWTVVNEATRFTDLHLKIHSLTSEELPSQKDKLIKNISRADLLTENQRNIIIGYLKRLEDNKKICHGDFHPDNILIKNNKPVVIDWLTAFIGNPAADTVRTLLVLKIGSVPPVFPKYSNFILYLIRKIFTFVYLKRYVRKSEISKNELEKWKLPVAAARLSEELPNAEKQKLLKLIEKKLKKIDLF